MASIWLRVSRVGVSRRKFGRCGASGFGDSFGGQVLAAFGDEAVLFFGGKSKGAAGFWGEFVEGELVGMGEVLLPFGVTEDVPAFGGDPVDARHVGGGGEAFELKEFVEALGGRRRRRSRDRRRRGR